MVGTLLAVGNGKLNQRDLYEILTIPSNKVRDHRITSAPGSGLYLINVEYPPDVLEKNILTFEEIKKEVEIVERVKNEKIDDDDDEIIKDSVRD